MTKSHKHPSFTLLYGLAATLLLTMPFLTSCKKQASEVYSKTISDYLLNCSTKSKELIKKAKSSSDYMSLSGESCWEILGLKINDEEGMGIKRSVVSFGEKSYNIIILSESGMKYEDQSIVD